MRKQKVLIVDDQENFRQALAENLQLTDRYIVLQAPGGATALAIVQGEPDIACIILDYDLRKGGQPVMSGLEVIEKLDALAPHIPVVMISGITQGRGSVAAESVRSHAVAFLDKPFPTQSLLDLLEETIGRSTEEAGAVDAQKRLRDAGFITQSPAMARVCRDALRAAENDEWHVLLVGETGCGKEVLARALHALSPRAAAPFVAENCATIGKEFFTSTLFGHARNSFTNASDRRGLLQEAAGGTAFLDELTEMPVDVQAGLLRAIEAREFRRLGENTLQRLGARIIAATNRSVNEAIREHHLREDLRYRFDAIITIPPLRKRTEDIPLIVTSFLESRASGGRGCAIDDMALSTLQRQPWLGNVRQLLSIVRQAAADAHDGVITHGLIAEKLREEYGIDGGEAPACDYEVEGDLDTTMELLRRRFVIAALWRSHGKVTPAASGLGYATREGLKYWLDKYGIDPAFFSDASQPLEFYIDHFLGSGRRGH